MKVISSFPRKRKSGQYFLWAKKPGFPLLLTVALMPVDVCAQEPATKLEAFERQTGTVITQSYSRVGTVKRFSTIYRDSGEGILFTVCVQEFTAPLAGKQQLGISISSLGCSKGSRVDHDEIGPLLNGIDYFLTSGRRESQSENFQIFYRTEDDFQLMTLGRNNVKVMVEYGTSKRSISIKELTDLQLLIAKAGQQLDLIKTRPKGIADHIN